MKIHRVLLPFLRGTLGFQLIVFTKMTSTTSALASLRPADETTDNLSTWSKRWKESKTGWHKLQPHHFLEKYGHEIIPNFATPPSTIDAACTDSDHATAGKQVRVFVPLCGKTVDMAFMAEHRGVREVVGIDGIRKALDEFSTENPNLQIEEQSTHHHRAVEKLSGNGIALLRGDLFDLDDDMTGGKFDCIFDRASLVAIQPELRERYVETMGKLMKPGGTILLVTLDRRDGTDDAKKAGPPYSVDEREVRRLYEGLDWVTSVTKLDEFDELENDKSRIPHWKEQGINLLFELCLLIKVK